MKNVLCVELYTTYLKVMSERDQCSDLFVFGLKNSSMAFFTDSSVVLVVSIPNLEQVKASPVYSSNVIVCL